jgi:hypothetical protein
MAEYYTGRCQIIRQEDGGILDRKLAKYEAGRRRILDRREVEL